MLTFEAPWLFALLPLPALVWWLVPPHREQVEAVRAPFFGRLARLSGQDPSRGAVVLARPRFGWAVLLLAWLGLVAALARPVWRGDPQTISKSARDLLLAVDLSGSMEIEDFVDPSGEERSRLTAVREVLDGFIARRDGDRLGLVVFGAAPFVQVPFTQDTEVTRQLLDELAVGMAGDQTVIGDAIGLAVRIFSSSEASNRVLILLTDGNDTGSLVPPLQAAEIAANEGMTIHVIGVGDPAATGKDRLNEEVLADIAERTGGRYFFAGDESELEGIYAELDRLEPIEFESKTFVPKRPLYPLPLGVAVVAWLVFAVVAWWQVTRRTRASAPGALGGEDARLAG